jgi:hypothetical protein
MRIILVFALFFLAANSAYAHSPYLIKEGIVADPNGNEVILEKLYGDGIFTADPVSFQIRSKNGTLLAFTSTASQIGVVCPHVKFCWAFLYWGILPVGIGLKLDHQSIDWNKPAPHEKLGEKRAEEFKKYLEDNDQKRAYGFEYPEHRKDNSTGFTEVWWTFPFSPIFIIAGYIVPLIAILFLTALPLFLYACVKKYLGLNNISAILISALTTLVTLGYAAFYLLALFICWFTIGTPTLYMLLFIALGLITPKFVLKRIKRQPTP